MKSKLLTVSLLAAAMFAGLGLAPVMAQNTNTPGIERAHQEISARIQQGISNGSITPSEAQALYQRGREIEFRENQFKSNGNASPQERQMLRADLDGLNADVERMMANRDVVRPVNNPGNNNTPGIDRTHQTITARIQQGIGSGDLTPSEAQALNRRSREIEIRENQFKSNGDTSPQERQTLRADLEGLSADVERMMTNSDVVRQGNTAGNNNTPGIDRTRQTIAARIQQGISSGDLTPSEAQALNRRSREIEMRENQFKSNGDTSPQERQTLRADFEGLSADVERMMTNSDVVRQGNNNTPGIDNAQDDIGDRIDEGVSAGRISEREARRLHRREREIERHEASFKSDGVVTSQERRQLRNEVTALRNEVERMLRKDRRRG